MHFMVFIPQRFGYAMNKVEYKLKQKEKQKIQRIQEVWNFIPLGAKRVESLKSLREKTKTWRTSKWPCRRCESYIGLFENTTKNHF